MSLMLSTTSPRTLESSRDALYNRRNQAQKDVDATLKKLKGLKDEYYGQIRAYREQNAAEIAARKERERVEREEAEKERRREVAEEKLEIASEPAFASQIATAKNLLAYFDPSYTAASGSASTSFDELNKTSTRVVEAPAQFKVLKKETRSFSLVPVVRRTRRGLPIRYPPRRTTS